MLPTNFRCLIILCCQKCILALYLKHKPAIQYYFYFYLGNDKTICYCIAESPKSTSALKQQPSLRRDKQKVVNNENGLNATPEFKSFVAKKLSDALDR